MKLRLQRSYEIRQTPWEVRKDRKRLKYSRCLPLAVLIITTANRRHQEFGLFLIFTKYAGGLWNCIPTSHKVFPSPWNPCYLKEPMQCSFHINLSKAFWRYLFLCTCYFETFMMCVKVFYITRNEISDGSDIKWEISP